MKKSLFIAASFFALGAIAPLPATVVLAENSAASQATEATIQIEGLGDHYHTGDEIELVASTQDEAEGFWQWYISEPADTEWTAVSGLTTPYFSREATTDGLQIKAALLEETGSIITESEPVTVVIDDHHGDYSEHAERIYNGFFYNDEVEDRTLADWEGEWQSVYPYLQAGDLDEVFEHKASESDSMTAEEYKEYYDIGYVTDVNNITIDGDTFTFETTDGTTTSSPYSYDGYEVLTYERGNRGVRFIFSRSDDNADMPAFIQFSDHSIYPTDSGHFHLYWGDDNEALLAEMDHWPTYYPAELSTEEIVHEMLAH